MVANYTLVLQEGKAKSCRAGLVFHRPLLLQPLKLKGVAFFWQKSNPGNCYRSFIRGKQMFSGL